MFRRAGSRAQPTLRTGKMARFQAADHVSVSELAPAYPAALRGGDSACHRDLWEGNSEPPEALGDDLAAAVAKPL